MNLYSRYLRLPLLLTFLIAACVQKNFAQQNIDSLKAVLNADLPDTVKLHTLNTLMEHIDMEDPEFYSYNEQLKQAAQKQLAQKNISVTQRKTFTSYIGNYYNNLTVNPPNNDFSLALKNIEKAIEIYTSLGEAENVAESTLSKGICYSKINIYDRAVLAYFEALSYFEKHQMKERIVYTNHLIGSLYFYQKNYTEAINYYKKTLDWYAAQNASDRDPYLLSQLASVNSNIGKAYMNLGEYAEAENYIKSAVRQAKASGENFMHVMTLAAHGQLMHALKREDQALIFYKEALSRSADDLTKAEVLTLMGDLYLSQKNYNSAERLYQQGLKSAEQIHSIKHMININKSLYELYKATGRPGQSLAAYEWYTQLKDSTKIEEARNTLKEKQLEYEYEKKELLSKVAQEQKLAALTIENQKKIAKRNMLLYGVIAVSLLLAAAIIFLVKYFRQKAIITAGKNEALKQRLLLAQMNPHFIFNSVDNIQSLIYSNKDDEAINYLTKFSKLTRQILENSRENYISLEEELNMLDNYMTIQKLLYNNSFTHSVTVEEGIDPETILLPPMLTQPFIENAIRHGLKNKMEGGKVHVHFYMQDKQLFFEVTDNGTGLVEKEKVEGQRSLSTQITRERLASITARKEVPIHTFNITGQHNFIQGVKTFFEIPYIYNH